ncbi:MAG: universal stress protein [Pseudomonadota bacterium]
MLRILVAIDGSETALRAIGYVIKQCSGNKTALEIHLINVQYPVHGGVSAFVDSAQIKEYHREEGEKALVPARALLDTADVPYHSHLFVGEPAETITRYASESACDQIVIGTRGLGAVSSLLLGSVATKVIHLADIPVLLIK